MKIFKPAFLQVENKKVYFLNYIPKSCLKNKPVKLTQREYESEYKKHNKYYDNALNNRNKTKSNYHNIVKKYLLEYGSKPDSQTKKAIYNMCEKNCN